MQVKAIERFYQYLEYKDIAPTRFEKDAGLSNGYLGTALRRKGNLGEEILNIIIDNCLDINSDWLLTGKGVMLKNNDKLTIVSEPEVLYERQGAIPLIPLEAMAGFGTEETVVMLQQCEKYLVPAFKGADYLIQVRGNSMQPRYDSGDVVACKIVPVKDAFFQWGKVYVLDTNQGPLLKRVRKGSDADHVCIVSDNDAYDSFELHLSHINALAIVMGVIRLV